MYELPFGRGRHFGSAWHPVLNHVAGGWQISSILTLESGQPANGFSPGGRSGLAYTLGERLSASGTTDWRLESDQRTTNRWINSAAFLLPASGVVGNLGRNVILGPGRQLLDFSAQKSFRIREGHSLDFRMEGFNFWNHRVLSTPGTTWGSGATPQASFGQITGTAVSMRQLQLGLKYSF